MKSFAVVFLVFAVVGLTTPVVSLAALGDGPVITSMDPSVLKPGETLVTINGSGFGSLYDWQYAGASDLYFGSVQVLKVVSWSDTMITLYAPEELADSLGSGGRVSIEVGSSGRVYGPSYTIYKPTITSISPNELLPGNTTVTITGSGFGSQYDWQYAGKTELYLGSVRITKILTWSDTTITLIAPSELSSGGRVSIEVDPYARSYGPSFSLVQSASNDPLGSYQRAALDAIRAKEAWGLSTGSSDVVVAVIDDGVYINHPDLRKNIWLNKDEIVGNGIDDDGNGYVDDLYGWDFLCDCREMSTRGSHGTMVAGVIGAVGNNGVGVAGVSWRSKIMPLIVCGSSGCASGPTIDRAIRYAVDNGADVINISLGTRAVTGYTTAYNDAIRYAFDHNVVVVAAAGNGDTEGGIGQDLTLIPQSPVCNDSFNRAAIIGVAAIDESGYRTNWSNFGTTCVDVYAPGTNIASTQVPVHSTIEGFYAKADGTSFAAPYVAGAAALLRAKYPYMSNEVIRDRIVGSSSNGVLNVYSALVKPYTFVPLPDGSLISASNSHMVYVVEDGHRRYIPDYNVFIAHGFNPQAIIELSPSELNAYPRAQDLGMVLGLTSPNIPEGAIIRAHGSFDIWIVKYIGSKRYRRLVLSPTVFESYGHLRWEDVIDVDQSVVDSFTEANLVQVAGDPQTYKLIPQGDTGVRQPVSGAAFSRLGFDPDSVYEINVVDRDSYVMGESIL